MTLLSTLSTRALRRTGAARGAQEQSEPPLFLHVCPSFEIGGLQDRLVIILNHLGPAARHVILALDGNYACAQRLDPNLFVEFPERTWTGINLIAGLWQGYGALRRWKPDLFLTYNWASLEWAAANIFYHPCPHIHHEDGFGPEESDRQLRRRVLFRRLTLWRSAALVVPSHSLYHLAHEIWRIPAHILHRIPNGIEPDRYQVQSDNEDVVPGKRPLVLGSLAPLRPEKGLDVLLRVMADLRCDRDLKLILAGTGPEMPRLHALANSLGLRRKIKFPGQIDEPGKALARFDLLIMTSMTEQMPFSLLQAMAAGRAVAAFDVGDIKKMVSPENRPYIVMRGNLGALEDAICQLLEDDGLRREIGMANAKRVVEAYPQSAMLAGHRALYESLLGRSLHVDGGR